MKAKRGLTKDDLLAEIEKGSPLMQIRDSAWSPLNSRLLESGIKKSSPLGQLMGEVGERYILSDKDSEEKDMSDDEIVAALREQAEIQIGKLNHCPVCDASFPFNIRDAVSLSEHEVQAVLAHLDSHKKE